MRSVLHFTFLSTDMPMTATKEVLLLTRRSFRLNMSPSKGHFLNRLTKSAEPTFGFWIVCIDNIFLTRNVIVLCRLVNKVKMGPLKTKSANLEIQRE